MNQEQHKPVTRTILVVEDTPASAVILEIALRGIAGLTLRFVETAEEALRLMAAEKFSAVITDIQLPRMDGLELVSHLRSEARHARLPMLVVSGDPDPRTPARALTAGADAFFAKPYSPAAIRGRLEELLDAN